MLEACKTSIMEIIQELPFPVLAKERKVFLAGEKKYLTLWKYFFNLY
jgi:hypothetical protein